MDTKGQEGIMQGVTLFRFKDIEVIRRYRWVTLLIFCFLVFSLIAALNRLHGVSAQERIADDSCRILLGSLGNEMIEFAHEHKGRLPASLSEYDPANEIPKFHWECPSLWVSPSPYIYAGASLNTQSSPDAVIFYEPPAYHRNRGMHLVRVSGSVDWIEGRRAEELFQRLQRGINPP
jgi:hypothetical protein